MKHGHIEQLVSLTQTADHTKLIVSPLSSLWSSLHPRSHVLQPADLTGAIGHASLAVLTVGI